MFTLSWALNGYFYFGLQLELVVYQKYAGRKTGKILIL